MNKLTAEEYLTQYSGLITLCGSNRYFHEYIEAARLLTYKGWLFLTCGLFEKSYHKDFTLSLTKDDYLNVKLLHFTKILMSDGIVVVTDITGYYSNSTQAEIEFAQRCQRPVFYFNGEVFSGETNSSDIFPDTAVKDTFSMIKKMYENKEFDAGI